MTIMSYLDISTAHLSRVAGESIFIAAGNDFSDITAAGYGEGAFVSVPGSIKDIDAANCAEDLKVVLRYAYHNGCSLVRFNRDAEKTNLPTFEEWSW